MRIAVENLQDKIEVTNKLKSMLENAIKYCLEQENLGMDFEIGLLLVDNNEIRKFNRQYRGKDVPTDVLSFPMVETEEGKLNPGIADYNPEDDVVMLGDVVISLQKAEEQAKEYGHSFERELAFLVTHGIYHLLGYNHETEDEEKLMLKKQEAVLRRMELTRGGNEKQDI